MPQGTNLRQQDSNVGMITPESHYPNQHGFPSQFIPPNIRHPQQVSQPMNHYAQQPPQHQIPVQQQPPQPPPAPKAQRPRTAAKVVDPDTNQEVDLFALALNKNKITSNETSKEGSAALPSRTSSSSTEESSKQQTVPSDQTVQPSLDAAKEELKTVVPTSPKDAEIKTTIEPTASSLDVKKAPKSIVSESKPVEPKPTTVQPQSKAILETPKFASTHHNEPKTAPETPVTVKSQPEHKSVTVPGELTAKPASTPVAEKSTPINSSPPEAKTANVSPPFGRPSGTAVTNTSPTLSGATEPVVQETPKPEAKISPAVVESAATGDRPSRNHVVESKGKHNYTHKTNRPLSLFLVISTLILIMNHFFEPIDDSFKHFLFCTTCSLWPKVLAHCQIRPFS
jgi:hypothetical protein